MPSVSVSAQKRTHRHEHEQTEGDELPNVLGQIAQTHPNCFSENSILFSLEF
jgi:hypothetical protein